MNSNPLPLDDRRFDRLVDGELNEEERRELLTRLDSEPGGWRRCALAFLESQCWRQTFVAVAIEGAVLEPASPAKRRSRSRWPGWVGTGLAMAASFFLMFWVGSTVKQRLGHPSMPAGAMGELAGTAGRQSAPSLSSQPAFSRASQFSNRPLSQEPLGNLADMSPQGRAAPGPWRMVTVSTPAGAGGRGASFRLPAIERDNIDQQWLRSFPPAIPDSVLQAFNRTGHEVQQRRELVPVPLKDGRRLVVPVDQVEVHYVGNETD
jgi:hypothetical protein